MRALIQRVSRASVQVEDRQIAGIGQGLLIFLGVENADTGEDIEWLSHKILQLRIFSDENDKMNLSVMDVRGQLLIVSQFTLHASTKKGNRPSFIRAAEPGFAEQMYLSFAQTLETVSGLPVQMGSFGAMMDVSLVNDGPVTLLIDTKNKE